jgi:pimeloyl-ACP methyl ester carboxylesterase
MKLIANCLLVFCGLTVAADAPPAASAAQAHAAPAAAALTGDWAGSLEANGSSLRLVLHVKRDGAGLSATLDSPQQGAYGMEVSAISFENRTFNLQLSSVGAKYEGTLSADGGAISGTWSQGGTHLPLVLKRVAAAPAKPANAIASSEGTWQGSLVASGMELRLQLHVTHDEKSALTAALDSIDQGTHGLAASNVSQQGTALHFEVPAAKGSYDGTIDAAHNAITGTWTQYGVPQKLNFRRSNQVPAPARPQMPARPFPYREEEVKFVSTAAQVMLAGTLSLPQGKGPFAAAVLICGSGPHDRDETIAGHKPFLVLSDALTRKGFAVLRYDKRGVGKSTGDYAQATTSDFAADALGAFAYLKTRSDIDHQKTGLIGHSEGAMIAPMIASQAPGVAWVVLLAGPGTIGERTLLDQSELISRAAGLPDEQIKTSLDFDRQAYAMVRQTPDATALRSKLHDLVKSSGMAGDAPPAALQAQIDLIASPWFRYFLDYDPVPALRELKCPVLALTGEKDLQVPARDNLPLVRKALEDGGNKDFQVVELPGLNHLFQHARSGSPAEYGAIQETMAPEVLTEVSAWISKHTAP